jgi:hypothetical protein
MGVEFAAAGYGDARERREALAQSARDGSRSDWRLYRHCHGQAAIAARSNADFAGRLVGRGGRLLGAAVAKNGLRLIDGFGYRPRGRKSGYQAGERNRISGGQRNQALPQRPLGECYPHHPVSDPDPG